MKVYFDNAATTPLHPKVLEAMLPYLKEDFGNPSSIHSYGRKVKVKIEEAREKVAEFINADAGEIYFVSGGTEGINFPLLGIAKTEFEESSKDHIITTRAEHHAVLETYNELQRIGFDATFLNVDKDSKLTVNGINNAIRPSTSLLSVINVNNETGAVNDIENISGTLPSSIFVHSDAVQSFGKFIIDVNKMGVHSISASAHKIYGPKGIGIAWVKRGTPLSSFHYGGPQEKKQRGGTENVAGIIGMAKAVEIAHEEMSTNYQIVTKLKDHFIAGLKSVDNNGLIINGGVDSSPYILSLTFNIDYYSSDAEAMLIFLDINGIAASGGAACSSGALKPSHVITASGRTEKEASGTLRFSFNPLNTIDEIDYTLDIISKMCGKFKK